MFAYDVIDRLALTPLYVILNRFQKHNTRPLFVTDGAAAYCPYRCHPCLVNHVRHDPTDTQVTAAAAEAPACRLWARWRRERLRFYTAKRHANSSRPSHSLCLLAYLLITAAVRQTSARHVLLVPDDGPLPREPGYNCRAFNPLQTSTRLL